MTWKNVPFNRAVKDVTAGQVKVQKKDYLSDGLLPVVDQGQSAIAGYTNREDAKFVGGLPVILFGDHTRIFKYVDYPFALGADGVKVLAINSSYNPKFLYYYFQTVKVPSRGYSRHFKFLKEVDIPVVASTEQRILVEILDQADALRKKRAEADAKAARILPALFYKMFGDPATNPNKWPIIPIHDLITPIARRDPTLESENTFVYIDIAGVDGKTGVIVETKELLGAEAPSRARQIVHKNDVIISTVRPYLRATALVPEYLDNQICSTGFCVVRSRDERGFGFLYALSRLQWFTDQLNARARGASYPAVTDGDILNLRVPYPNQSKLHEAFDAQVLNVLGMQQKRIHCADSLENIFATLLHRAFVGDLTAKWRDAHMKELLVEIEQQTRELG